MRKVEIKGKELRKGRGIKERNEIERKKEFGECKLNTQGMQLVFSITMTVIL